VGVIPKDGPKKHRIKGRKMTIKRGLSGKNCEEAKIQIKERFRKSDGLPTPEKEKRG